MWRWDLVFDLISGGWKKRNGERKKGMERKGKGSGSWKQGFGGFFFSVAPTLRYGRDGD